MHKQNYYYVVRTSQFLTRSRVENIRSFDTVITGSVKTVSTSFRRSVNASEDDNSMSQNAKISLMFITEPNFITELHYRVHYRTLL